MAGSEKTLAELAAQIRAAEVPPGPRIKDMPPPTHIWRVPIEPAKLGAPEYKSSPTPAPRDGRRGSAVDPEYLKLKRLVQALQGTEAVARAGPGMEQIPRHWKQMPPGSGITTGALDPKLLRPGDLEGAPLWESNPELYRAYIERIMKEPDKRR